MGKTFEYLTWDDMCDLMCGAPEDEGRRKMVNKWSKEEIGMLLDGASDIELMHKTGRSVVAIQNKRYDLTGHYKADYEPDYSSTPREEFPSICRTKEAREARIIILAKKMGIRIKGVGR